MKTVKWEWLNVIKVILESSYKNMPHINKGERVRKVQTKMSVKEIGTKSTRKMLVKLRY